MVEKKPLVSVIVPNYNHAPFLMQRLNSIVSQTFQDFEIIILDDCSSDNSREIIETFRGKCKVTHIVYNNLNSGSTFFQWEKGISLAKGEWLWIAESDDVADLMLLEKLVAITSKKKDSVLAYSATDHIDENGNSLGLNNWADELDASRWKSEFSNNGLDEVCSYMRYRNTIPNASAVLFKKDYAGAIREVTKEKMKYTGDWIFWMQLLEKGQVFFTPEVLNYQRFHSATSRQWGSISNEVQRIKEYIKAVKKAAKITGSRVCWKNKHYNWIYLQCRQNVPYNIKTVFLLFTKTYSVSFLIKLLKEYKVQSNR